MQGFGGFTAVALLALLALAGCQVPGDPALDSASPKTGSLGNGDFYFSCDDSVSCARYRNVSQTFPDKVAEGATFHIQYAPRDSSIHVNDSTPGQGYTLAAVGADYLSLGPDGFTGVKAGFGTIVVRTNGGHVVDFTTMAIAKPDAIVVYDAEYTGTSPQSITQVKMVKGDTKSFRTLAQQKQADLAGVFETDWKPDDTTVVATGTRVGGKISIQALKAGKTTIKVTGAALEQDIAVDVTEVGQ